MSARRHDIHARRLRPRLAVGAGLLMLALALAGAWATRAGAQGEQGVCTGSDVGNTCVMLIQVAGLEAKDVTPETTPFLWGMAHPDELHFTAIPIVGGNNNRRGFIWQAPRAVMTAGKAANTAALLTGSYPAQSGVPSDEYLEPEGGAHVRLGAPESGGSTEIAGPAPIGMSENKQETLFDLVEDQRGGSGGLQTASIVGDPVLNNLATGGVEPNRAWWPEAQCDEAEGPQDCEPPSMDNAPYCPLPRNTNVFGLTQPQHMEAAEVGCAAPDMQTLHNAFEILNAGGNDRIGFTFIHLAELGVLKRHSTDLDASPQSGDPTEPGSVAHALAQTDAALASFFSRLSGQGNSSLQTRLSNTMIMVVGESGWEQTPPTQRIQAEDGLSAAGLAQANGTSLERFVEEHQGHFRLFPQGTVATVYCGTSAPPDPPSGYCSDNAAQPSAAYKNDLRSLRNAILDLDGVDEVLYMRDELADDPRDAICAPVLDPEPGCKYPTWNLDHQKQDEATGELTGGPSGASGDLLVIAERGWATGQAVPTTTDATQITFGEEDTLTNPYPASTGGPRNRAVAALINGPADGNQGVVQVPHSRYPVMQGNASPDEIFPECPRTVDNPAFSPDNVDQPNRTPEDDASDPGRWCQAETVDFGPTIAALLQVNMPFQQIAGRPLNEAFLKPLVFPVEEQQLDLFLHFLSGPISQEGWEHDPSRKARTRDRTPTFEFVHGPPDAKVECRVDDGQWFGCSSPHTITPRLSFGDHTFSIRASMETTTFGGRTEQHEETVTAVFEVVAPPAPTAFFIRGPISGPGWENNKKLKAITPIRTPTFEFSSNILPAGFECRVDGGPWFGCSSPHTVEPALDLGQRSFEVRASTAEGGVGPVATAIFEVVEIFRFTGLIRRPDIRVTDADGRGVGQARPGAVLDHLLITADFGKPTSLVGLSFYRRNRGMCGSVLGEAALTRGQKGGQRRGAGNRARASSSQRGNKRLKRRISRAKREVRQMRRQLRRAQEAERNASGEDARRLAERRAEAARLNLREAQRVLRKLRSRLFPCRITTLSNFDPFVIERGHVVLRLRVPNRFKGGERPDYAGLSVRQAVQLNEREQFRCRRQKRKQCAYKPRGNTAGGIFRIRNARFLHKRAK